MEQLFRGQAHHDVGVRQHGLGIGPQQLGHRLAQHRRAACGVQANGQALAHAARPRSHQHDDGLQEGLPAWQHVFIPYTAHARGAKLRNQLMPLVRQHAVDQAPQHAARHRRVATAGRVAQVDDQRNRALQFQQGFVEGRHQGLVAQCVVDAHSGQRANGARRQQGRWGGACRCKFHLALGALAHANRQARAAVLVAAGQRELQSPITGRGVIARHKPGLEGLHHLADVLTLNGDHLHARPQARTRSRGVGAHGGDESHLALPVAHQIGLRRHQPEGSRRVGAQVRVGIKEFTQGTLEQADVGRAQGCSGHLCCVVPAGPAPVRPLEIEVGIRLRDKVAEGGKVRGALRGAQVFRLLGAGALRHAKSQRGQHSQRQQTLGQLDAPPATSHGIGKACGKRGKGGHEAISFGVGPGRPRNPSASPTALNRRLGLLLHHPDPGPLIRAHAGPAPVAGPPPALPAGPG